LLKNKKVREIVNQLQMKIIKTNNRICVEGRDIASKILSKNPKYDLALEIQELCFKFNNVKFVAIHDMGQGPYNRRINIKSITNSIDKLRKLDNFIFSTDSLWYRKKYAERIDTEINGNNKIWNKFITLVTSYVGP